jgi:ketosteroid isomerase-like protein
MSDDENEIRELIERWATAVHVGDLPAVLDRHTGDIVMFDVPPPQAGVRGLDDYRETWPGFFEWQRQGAIFEIVELTVEAGTDVAFAWALLRCGKPDEIGDQRLRLTVGLRRVDGRWVVAHEHHSFADDSEPAAAEQKINDIHTHWYERTAAKDLDGVMAHVAPDVLSYEHQPPLEYRGIEAVRESCRTGLESSDGEVTWTVPELTVHVGGDLAVSWGLNRMTAGGEESWSRGTRVFQRRDGEWTMTHQHVSFPV